MKRNLLGICALLLVLATHAQAQFSRQALKQRYERLVAQERARHYAHTQVAWVSLVENEYLKTHPLSYVGFTTYGYRTPAFKQSAIPHGQTHAFTVLHSELARAVDRHAALRGYRLYVPNPADLLALQASDRAHLLRFLKQGTLNGQKPIYRAAARKFQDGVVEIRLALPGTTHTALLLVDCSKKKVFFFLDHYKNRLPDR